MSDTRRRLSVLNTRPAEDADELSSALFELGFEVIGEPLLTVRYSDTEPPSLDTYQAVVFTSRNGVRAFARASEERNALVFAVGDATSREAQTIGFKARENLADQVTLDAIGLDNRESSFQCHAAFRVGRFVEKTAQVGGLVSKF